MAGVVGAGIGVGVGIASIGLVAALPCYGATILYDYTKEHCSSEEDQARQRKREENIEWIGFDLEER